MTPHASLQYTWLRTGSYTSKLNGLNAFHTEASNRHIGSVSAGLRFITGEMFSSTLSYSFNGSDKSENHAFMLNTSWKF